MTRDVALVRAKDWDVDDRQWMLAAAFTLEQPPLTELYQLESGESLDAYKRLLPMVFELGYETREDVMKLPSLVRSWAEIVPREQELRRERLDTIRDVVELAGDFLRVVGGG